MDINSIGSATRLAGTPPVPAQTQQDSTHHAARENLAAASNTQNTRQITATRQTGSNAEARNETPQDQRQNLQHSVEALNDFISPQNTSLQFSIDDESGTVVVKVMDKETKEVIKQLPSEEAIELAKALDKIKGLLVQQKA